MATAEPTPAAEAPADDKGLTTVADEVRKVAGELKLPAYSGKVDWEALVSESLLALRGKFFDQGLWTAGFSAIPDMQLDAIGDYILNLVCPQDDASWPQNYYDIIQKIDNAPPEALDKKGLLKVGFAVNYLKKVKLGMRELHEPYKAVPAEAMKIEIRKALEPWQLEPEAAGVIQLAQLIAHCTRRRKLCVMVLDASPFMESPYGGGKSQLLYQILHWSYIELGKIFDARKDIVYRKDRERMLRMFRTYEEGYPWGIDEFDQFFDRREWNKAENKAIIQALEMYRKAGSPIIGACGSIWNTDERVRDKIATYRLEVTRWDDEHYTGEATLFRKYGPPAWQEEKNDQWGRFVLNLRFQGITRPQYSLYMACNLKTMQWEEKGGFDAFLSGHADWGLDTKAIEKELETDVETEI